MINQNIPRESVSSNEGEKFWSLAKSPSAVIAGAAAMAVSLCLVASTAMAQTYEENLAAGEATTKQNYLNVPFAKPENWKTL